jgi:transposase
MLMKLTNEQALIKALENQIKHLEKVNFELLQEKEGLMSIIYEQQKELNKLLGDNQIIHEKYVVEKVRRFVAKGEHVKDVIVNEVEETLKSNKTSRGRKTGGKNFNSIDLNASVSSVRFEDPIFEADTDISTLKLISQKERFVVEIIPAKLNVTKLIRRTYKCPKTNQFYYPLSNEVFPGSILTPSFAAYIAYHKYELGIPFHHLEKHLSNTLKTDISKQLMSVWMKNTAQLLTPLFNQMKADLKRNAAQVIHADETTLVVSKRPEYDQLRKKSYVFVYSTSFYDKSIHIYDFHETRGISPVATWLSDYRGYVVCDDFKGYTKLTKDNPNIKLQRCWAHARRRFMDILKALPKHQRKDTLSLKIVELINKLFAYEAHYKENKIPPSEILVQRHQDQLPVLEALKKLVFEAAPKPNSLLETALNYVKNIWDDLTTYLNHPYLEISNNLAERAVKPFVINRKVFMTSGSYAGAIYTTKLYSIIRTAVINHLDVEKYLTYVLNHIGKVNINELVPYANNLPNNLRIN